MGAQAPPQATLQSADADPAEAASNARPPCLEIEISKFIKQGNPTNLWANDSQAEIIIKDAHPLPANRPALVRLAEVQSEF